jgi:hypothetical protein
MLGSGLVLPFLCLLCSACYPVVRERQNLTLCVALSWQVAVNWCICKGVLPIPGAKNVKQVEDIAGQHFKTISRYLDLLLLYHDVCCAGVAGAVGWRLSDGEMAELDAVSKKVPAGLGAPFEKW